MRDSLTWLVAVKEAVILGGEEDQLLLSSSAAWGVVVAARSSQEEKSAQSLSRVATLKMPIYERDLWARRRTNSSHIKVSHCLLIIFIYLRQIVYLYGRFLASFEMIYLNLFWGKEGRSAWLMTGYSLGKKISNKSFLHWKHHSLHSTFPACLLVLKRGPLLFFQKSIFCNTLEMQFFFIKSKKSFSKSSDKKPN